MYSNGQQNLGSRPVGYGRPPNSQGEPNSSPNGYGYPPNNGGLNRLVSSIAGAQRARHGQDLSQGFQDFSYNETKMSSAINGLFKNAGGDQLVSDEQIRINTIEQVSYKSNELLGYLINRYGRYFQTAKSAMNYFAVSKVTQKPDPVCAEFIEEVASNQDFYRYCCTYACLFFTSHVTNYVLSGRSEELLKNEALQFEILSNAFINTLGLAFMGWFENHPNSIMLNQKMFPETRARLESFESTIDESRNALINISVGGTRIPFPWKKGVLQRIVDKSHSGSTTYETYQMYNDSTVVEPNGWGAGVVEGGTSRITSRHDNDAGPLLSNGEVNMDWLESVSCQSGNRQNVVKPRTQAYEFTNSVVNDNWDNPQTVERKPEMETIDSQNEQLAEIAKKVNPYSRLDYDFRTWFKALPETNCYIIRPSHLEILSKVLKYDPDMQFEYSQEYNEAFKLKPKYVPEYNRYSREEKAHIPIVRLDWHKGTYAFYNLYVGKENVEPMLTNPDKVLPYVSTIKTAISETRFAELGFDELLDDEKNGDFTPYPGLIATATCKNMTVQPMVVYGNSIATIENSQEVINTIDRTTKVAKAKRPEVEVTAVAMQSMIPVQFDDVTTEIIEENLPLLLKDNKDDLNCEDFFDNVIDGLSNINNREFTNYVSEHLTSIVNRWLIEKRFYSTDKNDPNYLKVGNILEDYQELIDSLRDKDPTTRAAFLKLAQEEFLLENFKIFSSTARRDEFTLSKIENAKTIYEKEEIKLEAPNLIYIERDFIVVSILPMTPPDPGQIKNVICGSEVPQIKWIEENIPKYMQRYFGHNVPVLVRFAKDTSPRLWALTKSGYCTSKFTLRQLSFDSIIPLMKVVTP